ncbi:hypothetical protein CDD82_976 [Ophiocordyceps australis]|uniref:Rhamnogalacturonase A/B/Epimerase-like pectate lyase domain-containing protein n=1 Tax=Ophiocordyceps australis TaxID=1399860 RepID=A0A2C5YEL3_9HYPO|nr:hypothetical protein CDD82_976 [Ophiocordyceps australis]
MESCHIGLDCSEFSSQASQGTGSIAILDSHFNNLHTSVVSVSQNSSTRPSIVLDNVLVENSPSIVRVVGGETLLAGSGSPATLNTWVSGFQVHGQQHGSKRAGFLTPGLEKPRQLLDGEGRWFWKAKPQYEDEEPIVATDHGVANDGQGDQSGGINRLLSSNVGALVFFPAGIYQVKETVHVPVGSRIVGSGWSQIMGTGARFEKEDEPEVVVRVGNKGDSGVVEISDMLFTVKGATAGAILMEWNVHQEEQGSASISL